MDKTLQVQLQIRQNAEEVSSALKEIGQWEKSIKLKDRAVAKSAAKPSSSTVPLPPESTSSMRSGGGTVPLRSTQVEGYAPNQPNPFHLTPASIINPNQVPMEDTPKVPRARGVFENRDAEEVERERGNQEFKAGNFTAAAKSYTKCLGMKSKNYIAFSNRAMTYLKVKEYNRAVLDCNSALFIEPAHVKTLMRRATAFNALGKHRAAMKDLLRATELEPTNKQVRIDIQQTKELLRNSVSRAPFIEASYLDVDDIIANSAGCNGGMEMGAIQGPDLLPNGGTMMYGEPDVQDGFQRIQIEDDDADMSSEVTDVKVNISASSSSNREVPITIINSEKSNYKSHSSKKDAAGASASAVVTGAYELEKTLLQLQRDGKLLAKFVSGLKRKSLVSMLSKSPQLEPSVIYLLLKAISEVYGRIKGNWTKVVDWYESISQLTSFKLLFQLMVTEERLELQQLINHALLMIIETGETVEVQDRIRERKDCLFNRFEI